MGCVILIILTIVTLAWIAMGGLVFNHFESDNEIKVRSVMDTMLTKYWFNKSCLSNTDLALYTTFVESAFKLGIQITGNRTIHPNWDYTSSYFYSVMTLATVGYGNLSPATLYGRIFAVCYLFFGIPLYFATIYTTGKNIHYRIVSMCELVVVYLFYSGLYSWSSSKKSLNCLVIFKFIILVATGLGLLIFVPTTTFYYLEGWTYLESLYHSFFTVVTVGPNGFLIGTQTTRDYPYWYKILVCVWLVFTMIWLSAIAHGISDIISVARSNRGRTKSQMLNDKYGNVPIASVTPGKWYYDPESPTKKSQKHFFDNDHSRRSRRVEDNHKLSRREERISAHEVSGASRSTTIDRSNPNIESKTRSIDRSNYPQEKKQRGSHRRSGPHSSDGYQKDFPTSSAVYQTVEKKPSSQQNGHVIRY